MGREVVYLLSNIDVWTELLITMLLITNKCAAVTTKMMVVEWNKEIMVVPTLVATKMKVLVQERNLHGTVLGTTLSLTVVPMVKFTLLLIQNVKQHQNKNLLYCKIIKNLHQTVMYQKQTVMFQKQNVT